MVLGLLLHPFLVEKAALADQSSLSITDTDSLPAPVKDQDIRNIAVRAYTVIPTQESSSSRSYLFSDVDGAKPHVGRIILIKQGNESIMAFRVLRVLFDERLLIAKRVRSYHDENQLTLQTKYTAIERLSETDLPDQPLYKDNPEDKADLNELTPNKGLEPLSTPAPLPSPTALSEPIATPSAIAPTAPLETAPLAAAPLPTPPAAGELDASTVGAPPPPRPGELDGATLPLASDPVPPPPADGELDDPVQPQLAKNDDEESAQISADDEVKQIEDVEQLDINRSAISAEFGYFKSTNFSQVPVYYNGAGIRYGYTLGRQIMLNSSQLQDAFTLEAGAFLFKVNGYADPTGNDSYSIAPLIATARYTILTGQTMGIFFYGGYEQNQLVGSSGSVNPQAQTYLTTSRAALGGGLLFRFGPGWESRVDIGTEMIALGLMLRF